MGERCEGKHSKICIFVMFVIDKRKHFAGQSECENH